jgi:DNA polymerase-3 subunit epsilon
VRRIGIFDTETTGVDPESDHIVSAFFGILAEDGTLEEAHDYLIRPEGFEIPEGATEVHGITTEYAREHGADRATVLFEISAHIERCVDTRTPLCGHNVVYDLTILDREMEREGYASVQLALDSGLIVLDSLVIDKRIDRYRKGKRTLTATAPVYGVTLSEEEAHGARADAIASGRIMQKQLDDFDIKPYGPRALMKAQAAWKAEQARSLQEYFRTRLDDPDPDAVVNGEWPLIPRGENA